MMSGAVGCLVRILRVSVSCIAAIVAGRVPRTGRVCCDGLVSSGPRQVKQGPFVGLMAMIMPMTPCTPA